MAKSLGWVFLEKNNNTVFPSPRTGDKESKLQALGVEQEEIGFEAVLHLMARPFCSPTFKVDLRSVPGMRHGRAPEVNPATLAVSLGPSPGCSTPHL